MRSTSNSGDEVSKGEGTTRHSLQTLEPPHRSEDTFRALAETVSAMICILQDGRFRYVNPAMEEITEYSADELASMDFLALVHPDMKEEMGDLFNNSAAGSQGNERYELKGISKSGKIRWVDIRKKFISYQGRPALLLTALDITERKQAEKALSESEERLRLCAATAILGTYDWDVVNDRHIWSPETYEIYGLPAGIPLTLEYMAGFIHPEDRQDQVIQLELNPSLSHGEYSLEYRILRASDGEERWVYTRTRVFFAGEGEERRAVRVLGAIQDITRFKHAEGALQRAKAQAELYLDLMGHDINNMNQIALGYLELAQERSPNADQIEYLNKSVEVLQRSTHLIKNVRKLQMLQETVLETRVINVCDVLADVRREIGAVPDKPITLNLNGHQHCYVQANELLYDIFSNLATNAIKHTGSHAEIIMDLDIVSYEGSQYCRVMVEDDGPGIPDDFKPKVFNRLLRGSTVAKGMGLGLYLVKSLVEDYHGKIWVEDRVLNDYTSGTRFTVMLPIAGNDDLPG